MKINSSKSIPHTTRNSHVQNLSVPTNKEINLNSLKQQLKQRLAKKYFIDGDKYNLMIINNIVYNQKSKIVAKFKDFLLIDEITDFLKKYYLIDQCRIRLKQFLDYYESNSKIYPNYNVLTQSKYIYKNIQRKQKVIDNIQRKEEDPSNHLFDSAEKRNIIFDKQSCYSIMNQTESAVYKDDSIEKNKEVNQDQTITKIEKLIQAINEAESQSHNKKMKYVQYKCLNQAKESFLSRNKNINTGQLYTMKIDSNFTRNSLHSNTNTLRKSEDKLKLSLNNIFGSTQSNLNTIDDNKINNWISSARKNYKGTVSEKDFSNNLKFKTVVKKSVTNTNTNTNTTANYNKTFDNQSSIPHAYSQSKKLINDLVDKTEKIFKVKHKITMSMPKFNQNILNLLRKDIVHRKSILNGQDIAKTERVSKVVSPDRNREVKVASKTEVKENNLSKQIYILDNERASMLKTSNRNFAKLISGNLSNLKLKIKQQKHTDNLYDVIKKSNKNFVHSLSERQLRKTSSDWNFGSTVHIRNKENSPSTLTKMDQISKMYSTISTFKNLQNHSDKKSSLKSDLNFENNTITKSNSSHFKKQSNVSSNAFKQSNVESVKFRKFNKMINNKLVNSISKNNNLGTDCKDEKKVVKGIKISNFKDIYQSEAITSLAYSDRIIRIKHN